MLATLRTGYDYILDRRGATDVELLRVRYRNAERVGLGDLCRSPDGHWLIFQVDAWYPTVFIFNREDSVPARFQPAAGAMVDATPSPAR